MALSPQLREEISLDLREIDEILDSEKNYRRFNSEYLWAGKTLPVVPNWPDGDSGVLVSRESGLQS